MFGHSAPDSQSYRVLNLALYVRDQLPIEKIDGVVTTGNQPSFLNVLKEMAPEERAALRNFLEGRLNKKGFFSFNSTLQTAPGWGPMVGFATLVTSPYAIAFYSVCAGLMFALGQYSHQGIIKVRADAIIKELDENFPNEIPDRTLENNANATGSQWNIYRWFQKTPVVVETPNNDMGNQLVNENRKTM